MNRLLLNGVIQREWIFGKTHKFFGVYLLLLKLFCYFRWQIKYVCKTAILILEKTSRNFVS